MINLVKRSKLATLDITHIALFTVFIAVCSWIYVPLVAVPITMQTFAIFVTSGLLGAKRGMLSVLLYILLGIIGIPVFAGFLGGFGILLSPIGGYIIGFIFIPLITGAMAHIWGKKTHILIISMAVGTIICYTIGTIWFTYFYSMTKSAVSMMTVLAWCVFPFIIPDAAKICVATIIINKVSKYVKL